MIIQLKISKKKIYFVLFLVIYSGSAGLSFKSFPSSIINPFAAYVEHTITISISGNSDFQNQASTNGWNGDGSESHPYSITNLNITNSTTIYPLLSISDTDVYFNITNSLFDGGLYGIFLDNVTNGLILNNLVHSQITSIIITS